MSNLTKEFLKTWEVTHRKASPCYTISNERTEIAVKQAKRQLKSKVNKPGSLDSDKFLGAIFELMNTSDSDYQVSQQKLYTDVICETVLHSYTNWTNFLILHEEKHGN